MKTLQKFAENYGFEIVPIKYKYQSIRLRRKGFDLIDKSRQIQLSFEPKEYLNGDKWLVHNYAQDYLMFASSIPNAIKRLKADNFHPVEHTGHRLK